MLFIGTLRRDFRSNSFVISFYLRATEREIAKKFAAHQFRAFRRAKGLSLQYVSPEGKWRNQRGLSG